jgi:hypothetical protein
VSVARVRANADGLPRAIGLWSRAGRPVLRLSAGTGAGATVGSTVTITAPDGSTSSYTVTSRTTATTADAAQAVAGAASGELLLVVAAGTGSWTVVTAV